MSFVSDFFGAGGTGSSLVSSAGQIGIGLVQNEGSKIQGDYQVKLKQLTNDASLSQDQFQLSLTKLNAERDAALAEANDQKRNDTLKLVAVAGGMLLITIISVVLILKSSRKR